MTKKVTEGHLDDLVKAHTQHMAQAGAAQGHKMAVHTKSIGGHFASGRYHGTHEITHVGHGVTKYKVGQHVTDDELDSAHDSGHHVVEEQVSALEQTVHPAVLASIRQSTNLRQGHPNRVAKIKVMASNPGASSAWAVKEQTQNSVLEAVNKIVTQRDLKKCTDKDVSKASPEVKPMDMAMESLAEGRDDEVHVKHMHPQKGSDAEVNGQHYMITHIGKNVPSHHHGYAHVGQMVTKSHIGTIEHHGHKVLEESANDNMFHIARAEHHRHKMAEIAPKLKQRMQTHGPDADITKALHKEWSDHKARAEHHESMVKSVKREAVEPITELSRGLLKSYKAIASDHADHYHAAAENEKDGKMKDMVKGWAKKRDAGVRTAQRKLDNGQYTKRKVQEDMAIPRQEDDADQHIVMQLHKSISMNGKKGVKFKDGKTHDVGPKHAHKFIMKYMSMKPTARAKFADDASQSHKHFMQSISE